MGIASEAAEGETSEAELPLSVRIRTLTSHAHRGLEAKTGWPETLDGAGDMARMLRMFRALHASLNTAYARFDSCFRQHGFPPGSAGATAMIDADLRAIGLGERPDRASFSPCADCDAALGLRYVASGSAMGNMRVLRHIATHPDPSVSGASRFLVQSAGRAIPEFRSFRAALDLYGLQSPTHAAAVIAGADAAFHACMTWLDADLTARD